MNPSVLILVLNWNNFFDTNNCLKSLLDLDYDNFKIILIDNNSTDGSFIKLKKEYTNNKVIFLKNEDNLGYAGGMNIGIEYALKNLEFGFIWLLNNDIKVEQDSLSKLVNAMKESPDSGIAGPTILFDGTNDIMEQYYVLNLFLGRYLVKKHLDQNQIIKIDKKRNNYIGGAAVFVRKELLKELGFIPEEYFMYNEDVAWHQKNKRERGLLYVGPARVWHKKAASSGGKKTVLPDYYDSRNFLYFIKKYYPIWLPYELLTSCINKVLPKIFRGEWERLRYVLFGFRDFLKGKMGKLE